MKRERWSFDRLQSLARTELLLLLKFNPSDRPWQMPFAASLASGLPLLIGAGFDRLGYGLVSSLGGLVFLHVPNTALHHRMAVAMVSAFAMSACYALGLMSHFLPPLSMLALTFIAMLVTMLCRFYRMGPPGSMFFVMAASIGAFSPVDLMDVPTMVGLVAMGGLLACLIAFFYSLYALRLHPAQAVPPPPELSFDFVVFDSVVIGVFVGLSLLLAQVLQLERAYWAPVSCLAVIQGVSLRAVWNRQTHRIVGTIFGLLVAWGLLALPLEKWTIAVAMMLLSFIIEVLVVRHYGLAVIFITPLTILLADAAALGQGSPGAIVHARLIDTVLGALVGLIGGICLHSPRFREIVGRPLRRLVTPR